MKNLVRWALRWHGHEKRLVDGVTQGHRRVDVASQESYGDWFGANLAAAGASGQMLHGAQSYVDDVIVKSVRSSTVEENYRCAVAVGKVGNIRLRNGL